MRIYDAYIKRFTAAGQDNHPALLRHLLALQAFAEDWHVRQLVLTLPQPRSTRSLCQLRLVSSRLQHLQLVGASWLQQLGWLLLAPSPSPAAASPPPAAAAAVDSEPGGMVPAQPTAQPPALTCLSLRDCALLQPHTLAPLVYLAPTLRYLDLSGAAAVDDGTAGVLASLRHVEVLNLNYTAVGDATMAALTYGARVAAWVRTHGAAPPPEAAAWPELSVHRLHLAGTRVTATGVAQLVDLQRLSFLDVRGVGVPRAALRPLEARFSLSLVQGAVLAASNALAAALINHPELAACACPPADMAALSQASPAAASARSRRRQQAARLRAARGLGEPAVEAATHAGTLLLGGRPVPGGPVAAAGRLQAPVPLSAEATFETEAGTAWGPAMGPGWQRRWATSGIHQLIDTAEALLRAEGRA
ncbi:hypothetical protein HYH02_006917 [Chlamydomonas schloesseri]|uniref:Uncharacterized protein n=1 Tax=Chlamydomonas schloesseri TaxID=2026947 RepID=A0A835WK63_9CHLO|nr:hypothetical protein HYH02_006917 [Chlamydomonas schloesseri]|eukprot:KAG2448335.1 hypothetical protein HYH02_006917 [Chlamydomonas schloesseri]